MTDIFTPFLSHFTTAIFLLFALCIVGMAFGFGASLGASVHRRVGGK